MARNAAVTTSHQLSRQVFVDAALSISDREGVDKLSMRKVATHLGVSPMAMYKHFANKQELLVATLDAFITRADVIPSLELSWDKWLESVARSMYQALARAPSWAPYLGNLGMGPGAAAVSDAVVKKLLAGGFSLEQALTAYFTTVQLVIGAVCLRGVSEPRAEDPERPDNHSLSDFTRAYLQGTDAQGLRIAAEFDTLIKRNQMDIGLPLILDALRGQLANGG